MAPRLFPRNPKRPPEADTQPDPDEDSQLFSKDLAFGHIPPGETPSGEVSAPAIPAVQSKDRQQPGWYPDTTDPGLMRYWDGFHFTGQAKRPSSDESPNSHAVADAAAPGSLIPQSPTPGSPTTGSPAAVSEIEIADVDAVVESLLGPSFGDPPFVERGATGRSDVREAPLSQIPPWTGPTTYLPIVVTQSAALPEPSAPVGAETPTQKQQTEGVQQAPGETEVSETPVVVAASNDSVTTRDGHRGNEMSDSPHSEGVADGVSNWGKDAELAVTRALSVDTPEAWEEAAHVAAVVSEMAQTMQSVADAKQTARETAKAADEAAEVARAAAKTASDAKETAEQMAKAADDAAEAAQVAARKAVEAKEAAEKTALAAPTAAEAASAASQTAAEAKLKAEALEQVVASARTANTPSAWSEALKQSAVATEAKQAVPERPVQEAPVQEQPVAEQPVPEASTERETEGSPSHALWKRSTPLGGSVADPIDSLKTLGPFGAKDPSSQDADALAELGGPKPFLTPAPDGGSGSQNDSR